MYDEVRSPNENKSNKALIMTSASMQSDLGQDHGRRAYETCYLLKPKLHQTRIKLLNAKELLQDSASLILSPPGLRTRGFRSYPATPKFQMKAVSGRKLFDIELYGDYWLVSNHAKEKLTAICGDDVSFLEVKSVVDAGASPINWLCDVLPVLDAVDEARSIVTTNYGDTGERLHFLGARPTSLVMDPTRLLSHGIFRLETLPTSIFCRADVAKSIITADLTGLDILDSTEL